MRALRLMSSRHRPILLWLGTAMLCLRMLAPTGFMPEFGARGLTLRLCSGMTVRSAPVRHVAMPGMGSHDPATDHPAEHQGQPEQPCGFAGLAMPSLAAVDPGLAIVVPAVERVEPPALLHVVALKARAYLRPPPIGPPARA